MESCPPGADAHTGLLQRPVPTRPLLEALGGRVGRPAWSDLLAVPPPSQACMMTITFLPFTVSAATSQASPRAPGPPPGEGAHCLRRSLLRDADSRVVQGPGCTAGKRRGTGWQSYLPGEGCSWGSRAGWRRCSLHAPAGPQPSGAHCSVWPPHPCPPLTLSFQENWGLGFREPSLSSGMPRSCSGGRSPQGPGHRRQHARPGGGGRWA